jgi:general secretion pathway protein G
MRFNKRSRKIRIKKKKKKSSIKPSSFLGYLALGMLLLGLFYFVLYRGHEKQLRRIRQEKIQEDFDRICAAVILRYQDHGTYPSDEQGIGVLVKTGDQPSASDDPAGSSGYLERLPLDPWQNPYTFRGSQRADEITLICWGADGMQGGTGEAADVIRQGCRSTALPLR